MTKNNGGPAFPHPGTMMQGAGGGMHVFPELGMTLRDAVAIQAMTAIIAKAPLFDTSASPELAERQTSQIISGAFRYADEFIAQRGK